MGLGGGHPALGGRNSDLLANVIERAEEARQAELHARWEAHWKANAPFRAAGEAQARWITHWSQTTPEGQAWRTRLDAAPTLMAYHHLMWEAEALYAAWQQAHPDAALRLVEDAMRSDEAPSSE